MTAVQMSHEFDLLWNNIMSNQAPGLTEYEKSVLLTKAQDEVVKNYLVRQSQGNTLQLGVEDSAKRQIDFSNLTTLYQVTSFSEGRQHKDSKSCDLPTLALSILSEIVSYSDADDRTSYLAVVPLSSGEYLRLMSKPYKYPLKGQCWRLIREDGMIELIAPYGITISNYIARYIKRPHPIVTAIFPSEELALVYDNKKYGWALAPDVPESSVSATYIATADPEVSETIHEDIVQRAVELAKAAWSSSGDFVALGKRTE